MPKRPVRRTTTNDNTIPFGDVPFNHSILTAEAFEDGLAAIRAEIATLSGEVIDLSGRINEIESSQPEASGSMADVSYVR